MFEPARLWTGSRPSAARIAAIMPAVVVLPLVALTTVAVVEAGAEAGDRVGGEPQEHPAGQGRAAAAAAGPAGDADRPRGGPLRSEQGPVPAAGAQAPARGTITLSARGSTRSEAGRSLRCSPSA